MSSSFTSNLNVSPHMSSYKPHTIILTPWFEDEEVKILGSEIGLMHRRNEFAIVYYRSF